MASSDFDDKAGDCGVPGMTSSSGKLSLPDVDGPAPASGSERRGRGGVSGMTAGVVPAASESHTAISSACN